MKKLLFALCALAAIALLTPSAGFAQWQNRIGIYTSETPAPGGTFIGTHPAINTYFNLYFVLTNPTNAGVPMTQIKGFEFKVAVTGPNPTDNLTKQNIYPTATFTDIGQNGDPANAEYLCGYAAPIPVTNQAVVVLTWKAKIFDNSAPYYFFLGPVIQDTFPGRLAILDAGDNPIVADGSQPSYTDPVFAIGAEPTPVALESASFGAVKALFR